MSRELVKETLCDIIHKNFPHISSQIEEKTGEKLTSPEIGFSDIELYEFLMCIETRFSIFFRPEEIRSKGFNTLEKVCDLVCERLSS